MTKLEELKAAAYDADVARDAAYDAGWAAVDAAYDAAYDAYEAELKKTQEGNSND